MQAPRVVVVGAGIAGLTAAHRLVTNSTTDVVVLEAQDRVGGVSVTEHRDSTLVEWGPEGVTGTSRMLAHLANLGLTTVPSASPGGSMLWLGGHLRPLPVQLSTGGVPAPADAVALVRDGVLPPWTLLRMALEPLMSRRRPPGTLAHTYGHLLGRGAVRRLLAPFAEGVFGASVDVLSDSVVPRPTEGSLVVASLRRGFRPTAASGGAGLVAIEGGMGQLVGALSGPLDVRTNHPAERLVRASDGTYRVQAGGLEFEADAVVLALPPPAVAQLLHELAPAAATALRAVPMSSSVVVTMDVVPECRHRLADLQASGWLGAPEERPAVAAASFVGLKWPQLGAPGRIRASVRRPDLLDASDERLLQVVLDEVERTVAVPVVREDARVRRWIDALPIRTPDAAGLAATARAALPPGVHLVGTAEAASGVASVTESGLRVADQLAGWVDGARRPSGWTSGDSSAHPRAVHQGASDV